MNVCTYHGSVLYRHESGEERESFGKEESGGILRPYDECNSNIFGD